MSDQFVTRIPMTERRVEDRWAEHRGSMVSIDSFPARLEDISTTGARLTSSRTYPEGAEVRLDFAWGLVVRGLVVACESGKIRLRFETPIEPLI